MVPFLGLVRNPMLRRTSQFSWRLQGRLSARFSSSDASEKTALVLGCSGVLGKAISRQLGRVMGMRVLGADVAEIPGDFDDSDWNLDEFILISDHGGNPTFAEAAAELAIGVHGLLDEGEYLDTIVVASVSEHCLRALVGRRNLSPCCCVYVSNSYVFRREVGQGIRRLSLEATLLLMKSSKVRANMENPLTEWCT